MPSEQSASAAVDALIRAAREVDELLEPDKTPAGNWRLAGATNGERHRVTLHDGSPAAVALLILHDCLNDLDLLNVSRDRHEVES